VEIREPGEMTTHALFQTVSTYHDAIDGYTVSKNVINYCKSAIVKTGLYPTADQSLVKLELRG